MTATLAAPMPTVADLSRPDAEISRLQHHRYLSRAEAVDLMRLQPQTLAKWAMIGYGPKFLKLNARVVRYRLSDIQSFLESASSGNKRTKKRPSLRRDQRGGTPVTDHMNDSTTLSPTCQDDDPEFYLYGGPDGPSNPLNPTEERAYRTAFLAGVKEHLAAPWPYSPLREAQEQRWQAKLTGNLVDIAAARGRHQAMESCFDTEEFLEDTGIYDGTDDDDLVHDRLTLWLTTCIEPWAPGPYDVVKPPTEYWTFIGVSAHEANRVFERGKQRRRETWKKMEDDEHPDLPEGAGEIAEPKEGTTTEIATTPGATDIDLRHLALSYLAGGVSLVPCSPDTKQPDCSLLPRDQEGKARWKQFQTEPATATAVHQWFDRGCKSVAGIGGAVSVRLLIIDFDEARFYDAWKVQVGSLADGLPVQRTGREGGGYHVWFRCPDPGASDKLAHTPDHTDKTGRKCAIETKGEGGYCIAPGSLHPSGRRYEAISGDFASIPTVSQAVADAMIAAARKLDECPLTRQQMEAQDKAAATSDRHRAQSNGQRSVIDAYNDRVYIQDELRQRGYEQHGDRWKRPGGKSLSVYVKDGQSFHHSANDPLSDGYWHSAFDVFCQLEHAGDCKAAVKDAADRLGLSNRDRGAVEGPDVNLDLIDRQVRGDTTAEPTTASVTVPASAPIIELDPPLDDSMYDMPGFVGELTQ